jgi:Kdo2-lipid IVA lauroyltransferase/acyltransferase
MTRLKRLRNAKRLQQMEKISFQHRLEYIAYVSMERLICALPDGSLSLVARFLAFLSYRILRIRRVVSLQNLEYAFPEKPETWRKKTAFSSYRHFALMILEFMKMNKWPPDRLRQMVTVENLEMLQDAMKEGRGAIMVSGHFGNWEIAMGYLHLQGIRSAIIQQRQKNRLVNNRMKRLREKWGMEIVYPRGAVSQCVHMLHRKMMVGLLGDQDAGRRGVFVPFFDRLSSTHIGAAAIHLKSGSPMLLGTCIRGARGGFILKFQQIPDGRAGEESRKAIIDITSAHTALLENAVRQHPEQYFWMHKRWKTNRLP